VILLLANIAMQRVIGQCEDSVSSCHGSHLESPRRNPPPLLTYQLLAQGHCQILSQINANLQRMRSFARLAKRHHVSKEVLSHNKI